MAVEKESYVDEAKRRIAHLSYKLEQRSLCEFYIRVFKTLFISYIKLYMNKYENNF